MNPDVLKQIENRLLELRAQLIKDMGHFSKDVFMETSVNSSGDLSAYHSHMADHSTDAMEREKAFYLMSAEGRLLISVNDALRKIVKKAYGACEECGRPINPERLEAIPYARLCMRCKTADENRQKKKQQR